MLSMFKIIQKPVQAPPTGSL